MIAWASTARSRAEALWFGSGRPAEFSKWEWVMPSRAASAFISAANADSEPPTCSAKALAASLPLSMMTPRSMSIRGTWALSGTNMQLSPSLPPRHQALRDIVTGSVGFSLPLLRPCSTR
jgi:hypothetical protein